LLFDTHKERKVVLFRFWHICQAKQTAKGKLKKENDTFERAFSIKAKMGP